MNKSEVVDLLEFIRNCYPNRFEVTVEIATTWHTIFADCDTDSVKYCVELYVKSNEYPPTPASIMVKYEQGIRTMNERMEAFCNVIMAYADYFNSSDGEECVRIFRQYMSEIPIMKRLSYARLVSQNFIDCAKQYQGKNINFDKWIKGAIANVAKQL